MEQWLRPLRRRTPTIITIVRIPTNVTDAVINNITSGVRDAALTMDVVVKLYAAATDSEAKSAYEQILFQYAQARADEQNDPNLQTGLSEPKFELNNTVFTGPWGRPQNDGPAESATTLIEFTTAYLANGGDMNTVKERIWDSKNFATQAPVLKDLLFVASNWPALSFDLWEEESADHFFNRLVSHRALAMGSRFATNLGDTDTAETLSAATDAVAASLPSFWDDDKQLIVYETGPVLLNKSSYKDIAVVLGVLHGYNDDNVYGYTDDQVLATAYQIATSFLSVYPIANVTTDSSGGTLGIPVGYVLFISSI
jgi:glucoamylase